MKSSPLFSCFEKKGFKKKFNAQLSIWTQLLSWYEASLKVHQHFREVTFKTSRGKNAIKKKYRNLQKQQLSLALRWRWHSTSPGKLLRSHKNHRLWRRNIASWNNGSKATCCWKHSQTHRECSLSVIFLVWLFQQLCQKLFLFFKTFTMSPKTLNSTKMKN